jgi:hypothetical protein
MKTPIDQAVDRFLCWKLPEGFCPDNGITFKRESDYEHPEFGRTKYEPTGTNLFDAQQAKDMLEHVCEPLLTALQERDAEIVKLMDVNRTLVAKANRQNIHDARQAETIAAQRKVLEQALEALKLCSETISIEQIYERGKAITAIQEQLK